MRSRYRTRYNPGTTASIVELTENLSRLDSILSRIGTPEELVFVGPNRLPKSRRQLAEVLFHEDRSELHVVPSYDQIRSSAPMNSYVWNRDNARRGMRKLRARRKAENQRTENQDLKGPNIYG